MTSTASSPVHPVDHSAVLAAIPRLLGHPPHESVVLVPLRGGTPTGALRFDLAVGDPSRAARVWIGALGRFGRVERLVIALFSSGRRDPSAGALLGALSSRAQEVGLAVEVLVPSGARRPTRPGSGTTILRRADDTPSAELLPVVGRGEALAIAAEVDALLDRHPRARLPEAVMTDVETLLLRAASGRPWQPRTRALAALIVGAQGREGRERVIRLVASPDRAAAPSVIGLVAHAAAAAPGTERGPLLVLLATLHWSSGSIRSAALLAREAVRLDPHDHDSRILVAALEGGEPCPWAVEGRRAA
ncbi:DUF4192 family protein [Rathayibacter sp. PhB151]|uniref:DUF4192 family protein n=1 Tax=Rathayibacter sp. PhB151 TaxID=2485189 RepID=UPI0010633031|nr:DUF4192 family protein [Rathayibacter sp. PhB151]